jgi:mannose/cellobiose epimerase-like protein (N-acyl-D-glucosamine 2-epimerase family)
MSRTAWPLLLLAIAACSSAPTPPPAALPVRPVPAEVAATRGTVESLLLKNVIPFWHPQVLDTEDGGYRLNHDPKGAWKGKANKSIVTQARTLWFYSRLMRTPYAKPEYLDAARHGFRFLRDRMWDPWGGGFFWEVDSPGKKVTVPVKHLYGQAFALYALSEYARVSGDVDANDLARTLFRTLEVQAHDPLHGGYLEFFQADWKPATAETPKVMGHPSPTDKLMNTHLHLMEAFTAYVDLTRDPLARERLLELIAIQTNAVVRKSVGACTDKYQRDWTPLTGVKYDVVSYGHDIENVWLIADACRAARIPTGPYRDLFRTLFGYSLQHGFDAKEGGFYDSGPFGAPAARKDKVWWVQAEGLVAALTMTALFDDKAYPDCYRKTLDWITKRQADGDGGDWHETIRENGTLGGSKAHAWKGPYHNGRAIIQCLEILEAAPR